MIVRFALSILALMMSWSAFAGGDASNPNNTQLLQPGEKMVPHHLLEFEDDPGHFIFVGKSERQYNVFEYKNGTLTEIHMIDGTVMFDGGSLNLYLAGKLRLFVPSNQTYNYVQGRTDSYMIYPDRAREKLIKRDFDRKRLATFGLEPLLKEEPKRNPYTPEPYVTMPDDPILVYMERADGGYASSEQKKKIEEIFARFGCKMVESDGGRMPSGTFLFACPYRQSNEAVAALKEFTEYQTRQFGHAAAFLGTPDFQTVTDAVDALLKEKVPLSERMKATAYILLNSETWITMRPSEKYFESVRYVNWTLEIIDGFTELVNDAALRDIKYHLVQEQGWPADWEHFQKVDRTARLHLVNHTLYRNVGGPLRSYFVNSLKRMRDFGQPETTRSILDLGGKAGGAVMPLLTETWNPKLPNEDFLDGVLSWLKDMIQHFANYPELPTRAELKEKQWQNGSHSGGIFQELHLNGNLATPRPYTQDSRNLFTSEEKIPLYPFVLLGLKEDARHAKKRIVSWVIQSDKIVSDNLVKLSEAGKFAEFVERMQVQPEAVPFLRIFWRKDTLTADETVGLIKANPFFEGISRENILKVFSEAKRSAIGRSGGDPYTGSDLIVNVIRGLSWPDNSYTKMEQFRLSNYYGNVIDMLTELLENSEDVVKTQGTYIAILETSVELQRRILAFKDEDADIVTGALRDKANLLTRTVQNKLLNTMSWVNRNFEDSAACKMLLDPNPREIARSLR